MVFRMVYERKRRRSPYSAWVIASRPSDAPEGFAPDRAYRMPPYTIMRNARNPPRRMAML
jgi:hypothetical protein